MNVRKRKAITAVIAVVAASVILLSGTLAWQSYNQEALNEVRSMVNPGGRLHDDFVDITFGADQIADYKTMTFSKDVYVENYMSLANNGVQIFARVRLDEYMELGPNAGGDKTTINEAKSIVPESRLEDKSTWRTHIPEDENDPFREYWNWTLGGDTTYMPTFNKDNTSLKADINGTFQEEFKDYKDYAGISEKHADEPDTIPGEATYYNSTENKTYTINETHQEKHTIEGRVITMQAWLEQEGMAPGNYWVWDTDGWAYWANPIDPDRATGLLLDGISRTETVINEDWYYGINVVAQFITGDDIGYGKGLGFYDITAGTEPSENALLLLRTIGVDVPAEVGDEIALRDALRLGGSIVLTNDIVISSPLEVTEDTTLDLGGHTITNTVGIYNEAAKNWSLLSVRGSGTTLTINSGIFKALADDCFVVDVREGAKVVINDGHFSGNISAVYAREGTAVINGGTFAIQQANTTPGEGAHDQMINAYDESFASGKSHIIICGGTFYGFDPSNANDGDLVADGYTVSNTDGVYTVFPK